MKSPHYIIHRVNIDIEAPDVPTARRMQGDAVRIFNNWIVPRLEELLNQTVPGDVVLHLESLDLSLDSIDSTEFEQDFGEAFLKTFNEKIGHVVAAATDAAPEESAEPVRIMSDEERNFSILNHFLSTGQLPWWCETKPTMLEEKSLIIMLESQSRQDSNPLTQLISLLATRQTATERLFLQFSQHFIYKLIDILLNSIYPGIEDEHNKQTFDSLRKLLEETQATTAYPINRLREVFQIILRLQLNAQTLPKADSPSHPKDYIEKIIKQLHPPDQNRLGRSPPISTDQPPSRQKHTPIEDELSHVKEQTTDEGTYVDHAGLVLLHPFLEYYFKEFDLLADQEFRDTEAMNLAVHLLNFLATGRETPPEYLLSFEKFLCGADLLTPIPRFMRLTDHMKEESDKLLRAAIGHWKALKTTSPDGLREGFIQRPGKLITTNFECRLMVEAKGQDVLLSYLPWGYGLIKLPWLNTPLFVEWVN